jgi:hypothetical protein
MLTIPKKSRSIFNFSEKGVFKDFLQIFLLFGLAVYFVYYAPLILNKLFFGVTLLLFYKSKKDYIWIAFAFLLIMAPGTIFLIVEGSNHNIPKVGFGSVFEFGYFGSFILTALVKAFYKKGERTVNLFKSQYRYLIIYLFFLQLLSFFYGFNLTLYIVYLKMFLTYTLFFSLPILIPNISSWFKFSLLVSPFVILVFYSQLYNIINGNLMLEFFLRTPVASSELFGRVFDQAVETRPTAYYDEFIYFVFIMCLVLLNVLKKSYLRMIIIISLVFSILVVAISASKTPIILFFLILVGYFFNKKINFSKFFKQLVLITGVSVIAIVSIPQIFSY